MNDGSEARRLPLETESGHDDDEDELEIIRQDRQYDEGRLGNVSIANEDLPSNEKLLGIAFASFMSFSLVQTVFAFVADSEAMKGDSAAMIVDSVTYLCNWIAEHRKQSFSWDDQPDNPRQKQRAYRKMILHMELIPPLISVSTLLLVTVIVTYQAIETLAHPSMDGSSGEPNVHLMMGFSIFNLVLDFFNVFCFARAKHFLGYDTTVAEHGYTLANVDHSDSHDGDVEDRTTEVDSEDQHNTNLNMCSAYTHVFADTLRSIAVIVASALASIIEDVTAEEADAIAAIAVSLLIVLSLLPLIQGLRHSVSELKTIYAD